MITTSNGTELEVKAVSPVALRNLLFGSGAFRRIAGMATRPQGEIVDEIKQTLSSAEQLKLGADSMRLYNYVTAYGVSNEPPVEAIQQLQLMGFEVDETPIARMHWLQMFVLSGNDANILLSKVIELTFQEG